MKKAAPLPRELSNRAFTLVESDALAVPRDRTRTKDLYTPSRSIRIPHSMGKELASFVQPLVDLSPSAVVCADTAAQLWNFPLPTRLARSEIINLTFAKMTHIPRRRGVHGHLYRLDNDEVTTLGSIRLTTRERTWVDLASKLALRELVAIGDFLVCQHQRSFGPNASAHSTIHALTSQVDRMGRRPGKVRARAALALIRVGADSPPETYLRLGCMDAGLPEPELCLVVVNQFGQEVAWPDLGYEKYKISIQYDGAHHREAEQHALDARRDNETALAGWLTIGITARIISTEGYGGAALRIRRALVQRGWRPEPA